MPELKVGNIWDSHGQENSWLVITTNSYVKKDGSLAMGRGVAKEAAEKFPLLSPLLGGFIKKTCGHLGFYGIAVLSAYKIIALQTKYNFQDKSDINLIKQSIDKLRYYIITITHDCQSPIVNMVYPGIGYGQLDTLTVWEDCLKDLAVNYKIWTKDNITKPKEIIKVDQSFHWGGIA